MGKFILIDFKKRAEVSALQKLVPELCLHMDKWIQQCYTDGNDGTPPNEAEAVALETEQIAKVLADFDEQAAKLTRATHKVPERRKLMEHNLNRRKGKLFAKYSNQVEALTEQTAATMTYCQETYQDLVENGEDGLANLLPTADSEIDKVFDNVVSNCKDYIDATFPNGVAGMDAYDDALPDGILSFAKFQEMLQEKKAAFKDQNEAAIAPAVEKVKKESKKMFQTKINEAIEKAMKEIETDLSDDVLPYLDEAAMGTLREELVASSNEYGNSRLDAE